MARATAKPTIDQLAVENMGNVPRFLQALEQNRYVVLDRDNLPTIRPTKKDIQAAALRIAEEERRSQAEADRLMKLQQQNQPDERARELLFKLFAQALRAHHDWLNPGRTCPTCNLPREPMEAR